METNPAGMMEVRIGPARLWLRPLEPWQWAPRREASPGPAGLGLELLGWGPVAWQGVADARGEAPPPDLARLAALPVAALEPLLAALQAPWLTLEEEAELELLTRHLEYRADYPGVDCAACALQEQAGEGAPDCAACPLPPLPAAGLEALRLLGLMRQAPPEAEALLSALTAGAGPRELRLLFMRWGRIASRLGRPLGPPSGGVLK